MASVLSKYLGPNQKVTYNLIDAFCEETGKQSGMYARCIAGFEVPKGFWLQQTYCFDQHYVNMLERMHFTEQVNSSKVFYAANLGTRSQTTYFKHKNGLCS